MQGHTLKVGNATTRVKCNAAGGEQEFATNREIVDSFTHQQPKSKGSIRWPGSEQRFVSGHWGDPGKGVLTLRYRIKVWGPFDLQSADGNSIRPTVRKSCALLAALALSDGHRQSRKWLQTLLWSESEESQGAGSLRQELARLKRIMGSAIQSDRLDIWLDAKQFKFDHLETKNMPANVELLQGIDVQDEAFEDWLRDQRQYFANHVDVSEGPAEVKATSTRAFQTAAVQRQSSKRCTVIFDCDVKGSLEANVAAMFFSEQLYRKLEQYDVFTLIGHGTSASVSPTPDKAGAYAVVIRIAAFANRDEVCLGVQVDSHQHGPRLGYQSVVLPLTMSRIQVSPEIGRLVQATTDTLLDRMRSEDLASGPTAEAILLANQARKNTFALDRDNLIEADLQLARAYELEPRGQFLGWRAFLRNTAFFQHRTSDIFHDQFGSEELSLEALHQSPDDPIVQAFASQLDYVNQGRLVEPMLRAERAVELDRSDPLARALLSNALTVNGHLEDAYKVALQSISLAAGSRYEFYFHHFACMAATASGDYEVALRHARTSVSRVPDFVSPRRYEIVLAQQLGDQLGVQRAVEAMRNTEPEFDIKMMLDASYPVNTLRRLPIIEAI